MALSRRFWILFFLALVLMMAACLLSAQVITRDSYSGTMTAIYFYGCECCCVVQTDIADTNTARAWTLTPSNTPTATLTPTEYAG